VWFQKISTPTQRCLTEILRGNGVSQAKILIGKYKAKIEFLGDWRVQTEKTFTGRSIIGHFWHNTLS